jgi:3',5'-nucleoside bisphosphate phosphatase
LIDLHLHTTVSDGLLAPAALVARAAACGLKTISVTDHDTTAGVAEAAAAAARHGLRLVPGVEMTSIAEGRDVHMLAYFVDPDRPAFTEFLRTQRTDRLARVRTIATRLAELGYPIDVEAIISSSSGTARSVGRPQLADALVAHGYATDRDDAFSRLLGHGAPAFVPRSGPSPEAVIAAVHDAGGITSLAHPGVTRMDSIIACLAAAGLAAIEVRHSDHDPFTEQRYREMAAHHGLAVSGGSDFHGDVGHRASMIGRISISEEELTALESRRP